LQAIKATKGLEAIGLTKQPRLAVMPLTEAEFGVIVAKAGIVG
jgi:predicted RNA-binding protein with PUA-like domain